MFNIWKTKEARAFQSSRKRLIAVVAQAAIANEGVGDGRLLPLVILDTTKFPDVVDLFNMHEKMPPGDADSTWVVLEDFVDHLGLVLQFKRPFEMDFVVDFDLAEYGPAVDLAMQGRAIYLQAGKPGDRLYRTMVAPRIIVEIGAEASKERWEAIWQRAIRNQLRREGMHRRDAKRMSPAYMEQIRGTFAKFRTAPSGMYVTGDEETHQF
jgi:hypothetical protein